MIGCGKGKWLLGEKLWSWFLKKVSRLERIDDGIGKEWEGLKKIRKVGRGWIIGIELELRKEEIDMVEILKRKIEN